jgi:hypothetical protein
MTQAQIAEADVIQEVRRRYRICNRLFTIGAFLCAFGMCANAVSSRPVWLVIGWTGVAIFFFAFVLTLAIYRCPVCNKYLSKFRPDKTKCAACGAQVREASGRP